MSEGTLQQLDTPEAIYDRPTNRFVAGFVGSPPINFVELAAPDAGSDLAASLQRWLGRVRPDLHAHSAGIRPESIRVSDDAASPDTYTEQARVTGIMPTGGNWIIELTLAAHKLFATTNAAPRVALGQTVAFQVDRQAVHVFDAQGRRIADPSEHRAGTGSAPRQAATVG